MNEKELQEIYKLILSKDPTYGNDVSYDAFKKGMLDPSYSEKIKSLLGYNTSTKQETDASKITGELTQPAQQIQPVQQKPVQKKPIEPVATTAVSKTEKMEVAEPDIDPGGFMSNTISSLDRGFYKNLIGNPVKGIGTLLGSATTKITGGTEKGFISNALVRFGDYFNNAIDELAPMDEEFKGTLMDQFSQAFGQVASLALTYGAGSAGAAANEASTLAKTAATSASKSAPSMLAAKTLASESASPAAISAGLSMGQSEFERAKEAGATDDEAFEAFYKNALVGSVLERIPIMQFMKRFNKASSGGMVEYIKNKALSGVTGGVEEMTTEVLQQIYANKTAKDIYKANQDIFEGVGESGGVGFGVGFLLNAMGASSKVLKSQGREEEASVVENQIKQFEKQAQNGGVSSYKINGINISDPSIIDGMIQNMSATDLSKSNIEIVNDPQLNKKLRDKIITSSIKEQVLQANPTLSEENVSKVVELEKELKKIEGNTTQLGKDKAASIRSEIKAIQEDATQQQAAQASQEATPIANEEKVNSLRAQEQAEYDAMPDPQDEAKKKEIYDKYDKLITPLLETATTESVDNGISINDESIETKITDENQKGIISLARTAANSLKSIMPNLEFIVHDNDGSYAAAVTARKGVASSGGNFSIETMEDGTEKYRIDVNLTKANKRVVAHEITHAVLYDKFNNSVEAFSDFKNRLSGVVSSMTPQMFVNDKGEATTVKKELEDFINRYTDENARPEEYLAELSAMLANNEAKITVTGWQKIATMINEFVSNITGGKLKVFEDIKNTKDVVDFFNSVSGAIAKGEDVASFDIAIPNLQAQPRTTPVPGFDSKASIMIDASLKRTNIKKEGLIEGATIKDIGDSPVHLTFSDRLATGKMGDKELLGGVLHAAATGNVWASSKLTSANRIINSSKKERSADGYFYMMPAFMSETSHMSSRDLSDIAIKELDANVRSKSVSVEQAFDRIRNAMKRAGIQDSFKKELGSIKKLSIDRLTNAAILTIENSSTFDQRRFMNESILGNADINKSKRLGSLPSFSELASAVAEPLSLGHETGDVILAIRTKGNLKAVELNKTDPGYHPSYKFSIQSDAPVETIVFKNAYSAVDLFPSFTLSNGNKVTFEDYKNKYGKDAKRKYLSMMGIGPMSASITEKPKAEAVEKKPIAEVFSKASKMAPAKIEENVEPVIQKIKNASIEDDEGGTFNTDGTVYKGLGLVVTGVSSNTNQNDLKAGDVSSFAETHSRKIQENENVKIGLFKFNGSNEVSIDLNVIVDEKYLDQALEFATMIGQNSIWNMRTNEPIYTGQSGKNTRSFNDDQFSEIAKGLVDGKIPDFVYEGEQPAVKGKASRTEPLITDKKILSQMTEDNDGNFLFYHVSPNRIAGKIDPKFFGRNLRTGRDERPGIGISMYYTRPDRADVSGEYKYVAAIPKDKVYPFNSDPLNLYDKAKASFEKMYPGQAFDPNKQVAFISKEAEKLGYQMTVAKWGDGLRAQTTEAIKPEWLERPNGSKTEVNEKYSQFKANSKQNVQSKASMLPESTENSSRAVKKEFVDEVNKMSMDKFGEPYFPSIDNPNVVVLSSSEVDKLEDERCKSNKCETNTYKLVKENPDKYYPVRGYFVNKNNYPVEHWWLYDRQSKKYLEITPDENENVPKDYIKGYVGVVNKNINEEIVNSNKVFDVDFFKSNQRSEFRKIISEENNVKEKASRMAPENIVSEKTLPGYESLVSGIAKYASNAISRGDSKADIVRTAVDIAQSSPIYEAANDIQREQIVREARKLAGASQKSSPSVSRLFGIKPKDVTMTELQALNNQLRAEAKGARESKNDINERRRNLSDVVRKMAASGSVSAKKAAAIINKISNLNLYSSKAVNGFIQYATNVFADADYAEKIREANATRKQIKKLSKSADKFANLRDLGSRFSEIDPSLVSDIDEYNSIASLVKESIKGSTVRGTDPIFARIANEEQINEYIADTIESQDQQLLDAKIEEAQDLLGFDATGMTYDEILELLEPNKTIAKDVENIIRAGINKAFDIYKTIINDILSTGVDSFTGDPVNYTENQKRIISEFVNIDPGNLKIKNALEAVDALVNFITNGSIAKMESVIERYNGEQNMINANRNGVRASAIRKYGSKLFGQLLVEQTASLNILFERVFGGFTRGGFMEKMMGITDIKNGVSKAKSESEAVVKKYVEMFYDKKANGQDFNTAYNNIERGMTAFLVKGIFGTQKEVKTEFDRRKNLIKESIKQLEKGNDQEKEKAKIYQQVFDKIAQNSNDKQDVVDAADSTNLDAVGFWVDSWADRYQTLSDVALGIYNKVLGRDVNYTPDRFSKLSYGTSEVDMSSEDMSFIFNSGNASFYKKEAGVLMKATKPDRLPSERYVDLSFDNNNSNSLYDALVDVNTAGAIRRSESAMNSSAFENIVESLDDRKLLVRRIKLYVNNARKKSPFTDDTFSTVAKRLNRLATIGVGQALGGVLQPIKQVVPIAINTLINAGGLNVSSISNKSVQEFINKSGYAIANRGIESQAQIETLDRMIDQAATGRAGKVLEKIEDANRWWLKNFLVKFDVAIARASWITYYEQHLSKNGVDVSGIDYANHQMSDEAADYAQRQVDRQQNVSDSDLSGAILSSKDPAKQLFTKIVMPFASFRMNQSARLGSDISTLLNKTSTKEDKKIAARSAAGFMAEMAAFRAISYGSAMVIANVAAGMMGRDDDDEEEKKKRDAIMKGQLTSTVADMFSPAPIVDKLVQNGVSKALESTQDMLDVEKEDRVAIYSGDKQTFFQSLGLLGITAERAAQLWDIVSLSVDGKFVDNFGNKKEISEKDKSALSMLLPISVLSTIGLAPSEANSIVRNSVRIAKKDAEKETEDGGGQYIAPQRKSAGKSKKSDADKERRMRLLDMQRRRAR